MIIKNNRFSRLIVLNVVEFRSLVKINNDENLSKINGNRLID